MIWKVYSIVGPSDSDISVESEVPRLRIAFDRPNDPDLLGKSVLPKILEKAGSHPEDTVIDLLHLAITVYAADLAICRDFSNDILPIDGWTRNISITISVSTPLLWNRNRRKLTELLNFLTGDKWSFTFRQRGAISYQTKIDRQDSPPTVACLFSGGLDSLCGAINLLESQKRVALVSHHPGDSAKNFQSDLSNFLCKHYVGQTSIFRFKIARPKKTGAKSEPTQRSRSFLFFALGISVANAIGREVPLYVPENGLISLNVPLTESRAGSQSTRTTHPYYIKLFRELLSGLRINNQLILPFCFLTKGEMLRQVINQNILCETTPKSMSCAHPDSRRRRRLRPGGHCGYCVPCLIRKAATHTARIPDAPYDYDVIATPPDYSTLMGRDLRALKMSLERFRQRSRSMDIFEVLNSGPIDPDEIDDYVALYRRGMSELMNFFS